jgi:hypothetical protein
MPKLMSEGKSQASRRRGRGVRHYVPPTVQAIGEAGDPSRKGHEEHRDASRLNDLNDVGDGSCFGDPDLFSKPASSLLTGSKRPGRHLAADSLDGQELGHQTPPQLFGLRSGIVVSLTTEHRAPIAVEQCASRCAERGGEPLKVEGVEDGIAGLLPPQLVVIDPNPVSEFGQLKTLRLSRVGETRTNGRPICDRS